MKLKLGFGLEKRDLINLNIAAIAPNFPITQFNVSKIGKKHFAQIPWDDYRPTGTTLYVSNITGNDTTGDGSQSTPYATINKALSENADIISIDANGGTNYYDYSDIGFLTTQPTLTRDTEFNAYNGSKVVMCAAADYNWSKTGGRTNVYQAAVSETGRIVDITNLDARGMPIPLDFVADVATCDSTPNSYFYDNGNILYIHTFDSRSVTGTGYEGHGIMAFRSQNNRYVMNFAGNFDFYSDGIHYWGGEYPFARRTTDAVGKTTVLRNGSVAYAAEATLGAGTHTLQDRSGLTMGAGVVDYGLTIAQRIKCPYNGLDGAAYVGSSSATGQAIEIDCDMYQNINQEAANNNIVNGSSSHDGIPILRLGGNYYENAGRNIGDTNSGTYSLNLGCNVGESLAATQEGTADASMGATNGAIMYVKDCTTSGSFYDLYQSGSTLVDLGGNVKGAGNDSAGIIDVSDTAINVLKGKYELEFDFGIAGSYSGTGTVVRDTVGNTYTLGGTTSFSTDYITAGAGANLIADDTIGVFNDWHKTGAQNGIMIVGYIPAGTTNTYWLNTASGSAGHGWQAINTGGEVVSMRQAGGSGWNSNTSITLPEDTKFAMCYQWDQATNSFQYFLYTGSGSVAWNDTTLAMDETTTDATGAFSMWSANSSNSGVRANSRIYSAVPWTGTLSDTELSNLIAKKF